MINEQTVKLKVASTSVEYARWGEITGNIENQTDLMNLLGERDLDDVQEAITQGLDNIDTAKEEAIEEIRQSGGVLTADVKNALLNCFQKVAWIDENGQTYYDSLYNALFPPIVVRTLTAVLDASGHTFYVGDSIEDLRTYLTVTAELGTGQTVTVNDYTLSGSLSYAGENIITVTFSGKSTTVTVNAVPAELVSISAVYTQSGTVYSTDTLDSLKSDLVVTATYSNSSTSAVASTDYTLSGTLTAGISTITVTYDSKTTTFNVTVYSSILYSLGTPTTFNGTSDFIDTQIKLMNADSDFTVIFTATNGSVSNLAPIFHCMTESSGYPGLACQASSGFYGIGGVYNSLSMTECPSTNGTTNKIVIRHTSGTLNYIVDSATGGTRNAQIVISNNGFRSSDKNLLIGCYQTTNGTKGRYWNGTVNDFTIYGSVLSDDDVDEYLGGAING